MMNNRLIISSLTFLILICACKRQDNYVNTRKLEQITLSIQRYDQDFNKLKNKDINSYKAELAHKYPQLFPIYNQGILRIGDAKDEKYNLYINKFLTDSIYIEVYDTVQMHFKNLNNYEEEFSKVFSRYHQIFPQRQIPALYVHISGFNEPIVVADSLLSISLENYLGEDHVFYKRLGTYNYQLKHKAASHIVGDAMRGWLSSEWEVSNNSTLLDHIIHEGKLLFVLQQLLPQASIAPLIGISEEQFDWCEQNKANTWRFMIAQKHLFSKQHSVIAKYIQDGPFFNYIGSGSSPMVGKYIGWCIVTDYMSNNPKITLKDLIVDTNSQDILNKSKFKP